MKRLITAVLVTVGALVIVVGGVLAATGVLHFRNTDDEAGATIDKKELKEKAHEATETIQQGGNEALDRTGDALKKAAEKIRGSSDDQESPPADDDRSTNGGGQP